MHTLPRMNVMLDFIWTLPVQLKQGTDEHYKKILFVVEFEPSHGKETSLQDLKSTVLTDRPILDYYEWRN